MHRKVTPFALVAVVLATLLLVAAEAAHAKRIVGTNGPDRLVGTGKAERSSLRNPKQEIRRADSGVAAGEIVLAVYNGVDVVPVETVTNDVETKSHEMAASRPAQVVDPLKSC